MKILIVEDEAILADSLKVMLTKKGFEAECVYDGDEGYEYAITGIYDLIIMDVMMPGRDGYTLLSDLRRDKCATPVLMLTAKSQLEDRIKGLDVGADYYLTKPFDSGELLACINALLRRQGKEINEISFGGTSLDISSALLVCGEKSVRLSAKEFEVARQLLKAGEHNVSKETLLINAWGYDSNATENHVEVYVGFLRKKLKSIDSKIKIESIRGLGYHLEVADD